LEDFARFLNDDSDFQPHCVSRRRPVDSPQGSRRRRPLRHLQPPAQPLLPVVARVATMPTRTRTAVTLPLTSRTRACPLPVTRPGMRG